MVTAEDVRRSAKVALILRAGRAGSNPAPGRQVHPDAVDFWGLPAGTTITPGMRRLTAAQREQFQALTPEQRSRYFEARRTGTHAAAIKAVKPAPAKAAKKAVPVKRVLWGSHPGYNGGQPLKLTGGTDREISAEARRRRAEGWDVQVRGEGERPSEGFRLVAEQGGSGAVREASERARKAAAAPAKKATPRAAKSTPTKAERMDALEAHAGMRMDHGDREGALAAIEQMRRLDPKGRDWDQLRRDVEIDMMSRPEIDAELRKRGLSTAGGSQEAKARLREAEKAEHLGAAKATPAPVSDQRIAEAERRAARTRQSASSPRRSGTARRGPGSRRALPARDRRRPRWQTRHQRRQTPQVRRNPPGGGSRTGKGSPGGVTGHGSRRAPGRRRQVQPGHRRGRRLHQGQGHVGTGTQGQRQDGPGRRRPRA